MFVQIIALGPKMALIRGSIVLHRLIKGKFKKKRYHIGYLKRGGGVGAGVRRAP